MLILLNQPSIVPLIDLIVSKSKTSVVWCFHQQQNQQFNAYSHHKMQKNIQTINLKDTKNADSIKQITESTLWYFVTGEMDIEEHEASWQKLQNTSIQQINIIFFTPNQPLEFFQPLINLAKQYFLAVNFHLLPEPLLNYQFPLSCTFPLQKWVFWLTEIKTNVQLKQPNYWDYYPLTLNTDYKTKFIVCLMEPIIEAILKEQLTSNIISESTYRVSSEQLFQCFSIPHQWSEDSIDELSPWLSKKLPLIHYEYSKVPYIQTNDLTPWLASFDHHHKKLIDISANNKTVNGVNYQIIGEGEKILILVNAFGLNTEYWKPLLKQLINNYRIIICDHLYVGSEYNNDYYIRDNFLSEYQQQLSKILVQEKATEYYFLAWCSGPKIALSLMQNMPKITGLIMLTPSLPGENEQSYTDSQFEKSLAVMCSLINRNQAMAPAMAKSMKSMAEKEAQDFTRFNQQQEPEKAISILSVADQRIQQQLFAPFIDAEQLTRYATQLKYFREHSVQSQLATIQQPCLNITAEFDNTTNTDRAIALLQQLPHVTQVTIQGGDHYLQYSYPELLRCLIDEFTTEKTIDRNKELLI